jgi:hypothetical protein
MQTGEIADELPEVAFVQYISREDYGVHAAWIGYQLYDGIEPVVCAMYVRGTEELPRHWFKAFELPAMELTYEGFEGVWSRMKDPKDPETSNAPIYFDYYPS